MKFSAPMLLLVAGIFTIAGHLDMPDLEAVFVAVTISMGLGILSHER